MYKIFRTSSFKKDYKKLSTTNKNILKSIIAKLINGIKLDKAVIPGTAYLSFLGIGFWKTAN